MASSYARRALSRQEQLTTKYMSLLMSTNIDNHGGRASSGERGSDSLHVTLQAVEKSEVDVSMAKSWAALPRTR